MKQTILFNVITSLSLVLLCAATAANLNAQQATTLQQSASVSSAMTEDMTTVRHKFETVDGLEIFYREAGDPSKPAIVLFHGFPTSSHMYRNLIRDLADKYYLIAPDYPGFGESSFPARDEYEYTFDNIAKTMDKFLEQRGLQKYSLFVQDYGAPVGFRVATAHPERVQTLLVQNGNAYIDGIGEAAWGSVAEYWKTRSPEIGDQIIKNVFGLEALKWQYTHGTRNSTDIAPENWNLDFMKISRPGQHQLQLDLFYDYQNNLKLYPAWQAYLRQHQPPVLIVWGKNDAFFSEAGAEAYRRDVKDIDYNILNTGHFALEEDGQLIANKVRTFLGKRVK